MFRRRIVVFRRPRLLGAALIGGLGFAAGRMSRNSSGVDPERQTQPQPDTDLAARLKELSDLHLAGALSDEEFAAAKAKSIGS